MKIFSIKTTQTQYFSITNLYLLYNKVNHVL